MITEEMIIKVGNIFKPHGYKGEMNVSLDLDALFFEDPHTPFFVKIDNLIVPFFVEYTGGANKSAFLKFDFLIFAFPKSTFLKFTFIKFASLKNIVYIF